MNIEQVLDSFALTKNTGLGAIEREQFEAAIRAQIIPYEERELIAGIYFFIRRRRTCLYRSKLFGFRSRKSS